MIVNKETLLKHKPIHNMAEIKLIHKESGTSYGLTECGYDIRNKQGIWLMPFKRFALASSIEYFQMPDNLMGRVLNKSTWARRGVDASMSTNIEPGWRGFLTIELVYYRNMPLYIPAGSGIAQIVFDEIKHPTKYKGKYMDQPDKPVKAKDY